MLNMDTPCEKQYSETHEECLTKLCRLCSSRLNKAKKPGRVYQVQSYAVAIKNEFDIDVSKDIPGKVHPCSLCNGCRSAIKNFKRNPNSQNNIMKKQDVRDINCRWNKIGEDRMSCFTCHTFIFQGQPGRRARPQFDPKYISTATRVTHSDEENASQCNDIVDDVLLPELQSNLPYDGHIQPLRPPFQELDNDNRINQGGVKSPSKMTVNEVMDSSGPPTALDHKLLNCLLDKFDKSNPLIEVKTGGTVSNYLRHAHYIKIPQILSGK